MTSLTGGAATKSFSLDGDGLVVDKPGPADHPAVAAPAAECAALASLDADNYSFDGFASMGGLAIGYARVTVRPDLLAGAISSPPGETCQAGCPSLPVLAPASPYRDRLAWVLVVGHAVAYPCPEEPAGTSMPSPDRVATDYYYEVFLLDATTGTGALSYVEGGPKPCGEPGRAVPAVEIPREQVSVPWTMPSPAPGSYSGSIVAQVLPCDGYSSRVLLDREPPSLQVIVQRPVGAGCGSPAGVTMTVDAATVSSVLPASIAHDPTGLYFGAYTSG